MRRFAILVIILGLAVPVCAQGADEGDASSAITHGEFAVLLLQVAAFQRSIPEPEEALVRVKRLGLLPPDWSAGDTLTHGELADVVSPLGIQYVPVDRDQPASRGFVEALLRRNIWKLRDYLYAVWVIPPPIVSASEF